MPYGFTFREWAESAEAAPFHHQSSAVRTRLPVLPTSGRPGTRTPNGVTRASLPTKFLILPGTFRKSRTGFEPVLTGLQPASSPLGQRDMVLNFNRPCLCAQSRDQSSKRKAEESNPQV